MDGFHSRYFVVRSYSHTDKRHLIKVMSRGLKDLQSAIDWKEFCESQEKNKKHKFGIVSVQGDYIIS